MSNLDGLNSKIITARIEKISEIADETVEVIFSFENKDFYFIAGQYVWIELLKLDFPDVRGSRRAFSVASDPSIKDRLSIIFRKSKSGYKNTLISLPIGSEVKIIGPYGSTILPEDINKPAIFIAGGTGVAPFFSMISNEISQKTRRKIELFYFNDNENRTPYFEELKKLSEENTFFKLHLFFGKLETDGKLKNLLIKINTSLKDANWYVGGPKEMINILVSIFNDIKIPLESIYFEENYPIINEVPDTVNIFSQPEVLREVVAQSSNHIVFTDENGIIKFANNAAEHMTGYSFSEMSGQTPRLWGGLMEPSFYKSLWDTIKVKRQPFGGKIKNHRKDGSIYFTFTRISPISSLENGKLIGFIGTEEDITKLENIDRVKTEFISLASHQLRTPVTALGWYSEMLEYKEGYENLNVNQKHYIDEIRNINKRMNNLINDLLDVSHLELDTMPIKLSPIDLINLAKSIILELNPEIKKKKINLIEQYEENMSPFMADQKSIGIIFQNLLTNAVRYTPADKNGEIFVSIYKIKKDDVLNNKKILSDSIIFTVKDNGIGIPSSQSNKIFSKMFRADNAVEIENDGNGLGLYMVKKVVESMSGDIWFISEEGKGTTFYVILPVLSGDKV